MVPIRGCFNFGLASSMLSLNLTPAAWLFLRHSNMLHEWYTYRLFYAEILMLECTSCGLGTRLVHCMPEAHSLYHMEGLLHNTTITVNIADNSYYVSCQRMPLRCHTLGHTQRVNTDAWVFTDVLQSYFHSKLTMH